jgi:predicted nucleic acid-binding protein
VVVDGIVVVIDTNILFSALLGEKSRIATVVFDSGIRFLICETALVELFQHKEKLMRAARPSPSEVVRIYHRLLRRLDLLREDFISPESWARAVELCHDVDPRDTAHVAAALEVNALFWTGDQKLRRGLEAKGFTRFFDPPPAPA